MAIPPSDPVMGFRTPGAAATLGRQQFVDSLERGWTEGATRAERLDLFRALPDDARYAWLGHCVAASLEASLNHPGGRACKLHDHLGQVLGIEVARWWRPTGANYFDRVSKNVSLAALAEVGGTELAARNANAKKAELAQTCERLFAGELVVEPEVRSAALAWVPEAMRFPAAAADEPADEEVGKKAREPAQGEDAEAAEPPSLDPPDHDAAGGDRAGPEDSGSEPMAEPVEPGDGAVETHTMEEAA